MSVDQFVNLGMSEEITPIALDLEEEFLNHLADQKSAEYIIREGIGIDLLYIPRTKVIYNFVQEQFWRNGQTPTAPVLYEEFGFNPAPTQTAVQWLVDKLRERFQRNNVQELVRGIGQRLDDPGEAMGFLRHTFMDIERQSLSMGNVYGPGDHKLFLNRLQQRILEGQFKGVSFGFPEIDKFTGGCKPGHLAGIAARPKRMKTFFICKAFVEQTRSGDEPILFTLENTEDEIMLRIACMISGFPWDRAYRGEIMTKDWKMLDAAWEEFDSYGKHYIVRPKMDERTVPAMMMMADKLDAQSIIISQFRYIHPTDSYTNRPDHERYASIVLDLKSAATRQGAERPIYVETQLNREGASMQEMMDADLSQLGLTDMWGQACDIMFCLFQNKDMRAGNQIEFGVIDSRNTDKRSWYVHTDFINTTELNILNA